MIEKLVLTIDKLLEEAKKFTDEQSKIEYPELFGVTDGKAVGTYMEHKFKEALLKNFDFKVGNSASGIDFPDLDVDLKVTSIKQPQSSCPFKSPRQKIYGLGYNLLIFVYDKKDDHENKTGRLNFLHAIYVSKERTADYQMTRGLIEIIKNNGNSEDIVAYLSDKNLPVDDIEANKIAEEILTNKPLLGYLTISNALQWRLQYGRVIQEAGNVTGISELIPEQT